MIQSIDEKISISLLIITASLQVCYHSTFMVSSLQKNTLVNVLIRPLTEDEIIFQQEQLSLLIDNISYVKQFKQNIVL